MASEYRTDSEILTFSSLLEMAALRLPDSDEYLDSRRRLSNGAIPSSSTTDSTTVSGRSQQTVNSSRRILLEMLSNSLLDAVPSQNDSSGATEVSGNTFSSFGGNLSLNSTLPDLMYRHNLPMTIVYCVAYLIVFVVGLVGNCFVIAVVYRSPRMRTVTNFFIVNLAVADILVIVFCLPATLMSNIFVRKYEFIYYKIYSLLSP